MIVKRILVQLVARYTLHNHVTLRIALGCELSEQTVQEMPSESDAPETWWNEKSIAGPPNIVARADVWPEGDSCKADLDSERLLPNTRQLRKILVQSPPVPIDRLRRALRRP